jgi:hypothetical protein
MPDEELSLQVNRLSEDNLLSLVDKAIDNLVEIKDSQDYRDNLWLFGLLDRIMVQLEDDSKQILLYNRIRSFKEKTRLASRYFSGKMPKYASTEAVKEMLLEEGYLEKIVPEFASSYSFEEASNNSSMLLNFRDKFSPEQLHTIIRACIENDQIYYSFGARAKLRGLLKANKDLMSPEEKEKIGELMKINFDQ